MRTTRGSTVQPGLRNRQTMTPFMPVPPSEEPIVHNGIPTTSNAHPDCPEATAENTRQEEGELEHLDRLQGEGCRCLANQRARAPYFVPRPGRRQHQEWRDKQTKSPVFVTRPGRRQNQRKPGKYTDQRKSEDEQARTGTTGQANQVTTTRETTEPPAVTNSRPGRCHLDTELRLRREGKPLDTRLVVATCEPPWTSSMSESYQTVSAGVTEDTRDPGDGGDTGLENTGVAGEGNGDAGEAYSSSHQFACDIPHVKPADATPKTKCLWHSSRGTSGQTRDETV